MNSWAPNTPIFTAGINQPERGMNPRELEEGNAAGNRTYREQPSDYAVQAGHTSLAEGAAHGVRCERAHGGDGDHEPEFVVNLDHSPHSLREDGGASDPPAHFVHRDPDAVDEGHAHRRAQVPAPEQHGEPRHQHHIVAGNRQDHKDSLNRYIQVEDREKDMDHYLNPEDGKLALLRVQCAENYHRDPGLVTTWSSPLELHPLVHAWKAFRESPKSILTWTYNDRLRERSILDGSLSSSRKPYNPSDLYWKYPIASLLLTLTVRHCSEMLKGRLILVGDILLSGTSTFRI
ncbi:hypothetical protein HD806DRAFT_165665 [Xylariaceae sp. AK1471]|nr:hypothetical protein HD806DRAFT_165665 [Xylariaceae sp. AK1471]